MSRQAAIASKHKIGILGGIGALAAADFTRRLLQRCASEFAVRVDGDFPDLLLLNSALPDCDECGPNDEEAAIRWLDISINFLANSGCTILIVVCVSVSELLDRLTIPKGIKVLNLVSQTEKYLTSSHKFNGAKVLILCSAFTNTNRLFKAGHLVTIYLDKREQKRVDRAILEVIRGNSFLHSVEFKMFVRRKCQSVKPDYLLLGCTELPLLLPFKRFDSIRVVDPLEIAIEECLRLIHL